LLFKDRDGKVGRAVRVGPRPAGKKRGAGWPANPKEKKNW